jgi:hypothetical protein
MSCFDSTVRLSAYVMTLFQMIKFYSQMGICKEAVVAYFKILTQNSSGENLEDYETPSLDRQ